MKSMDEVPSLCLLKIKPLFMITNISSLLNSNNHYEGEPRVYVEYRL